MRKAWKRGAGLMATAVLVGTWGCDDKPKVETARTEATVKGTVTVKGKPATGGELAFDPSNYQRAEAARTAAIGKDGSYTVKTLIGVNQVTIRGPEAAKNPELQFEKHSFDVPSGESTHDIKFLEPK